MKLIIQIPCYNEEANLKATLAALPTVIKGITDLKVMVVDDGSSDGTIDVAIEQGVDYVVRNRRNRGLANTFSTGIETALMLGADIIVNTDGDNQYQGRFIPDLVKPIIDGKSEIVIGARPIDEIDDFTTLKKKLQQVGSFMVSHFAGIDVPDTTSGFRAYTRKAATSICVVSNFTYTLETIIQAGRRRIPLTSVPIKTNKKTRESRLFRNSTQYVLRSIADMILISTQVRPLRTFGSIGFVSIFIGTVIGIRFLMLLNLAGGTFLGQSGHVQSLILAAIFILFGSTSLLIGLVADQVGANRILLEKIYAQNREIAFDKSKPVEEIENLVYCKITA
jgi:glycosyltransferase involved in cell wall biosynthesis